MTPLDLLKPLCAKRNMEWNPHNTNRHRLLFHEGNRNVAFCFSVPIYKPDGQMITLEWQNTTGNSKHIGSNAIITVQDRIHLQNSNGDCDVSLPDPVIKRESSALVGRGFTLMATLNGVLCRAQCSADQAISFDLNTDKPFQFIRENGKYFAIMLEPFKPLIVISCVGTADNQGRVLAPCSLSYGQMGNRGFRITIHPHSPYARYVWYEINLHAPKLFQDTTVENRNAQLNNVYGSVAFIGRTAFCGEQWLYSKTDSYAFADFTQRKIEQVIFHFPTLRTGNALMSAFRVSRRFCSFGSSWNNKIETDLEIGDTKPIEDYQSLDITKLIVNALTHHWMHSDGFALKPKDATAGYAMISTGDNYFSPQILEIRYSE